MKRRFEGLSANHYQQEVADGVYLVRIDAVRYRRERVKPFYWVRFSVIAPKALAGSAITGRIWSTPKALWKLSWFLRDFGYDHDLFGRDEIDDKRLLGLQGVVKISHSTVNGRMYTNLDAFAPAEVWEEPPPPPETDDHPGELAS